MKQVVVPLSPTVSVGRPGSLTIVDNRFPKPNARFLDKASHCLGVDDGLNETTGGNAKIYRYLD